ncbi:MAG: efflux RND transporter periplasmic adaptor subunit [Agarilytica sp.]
MSGSVKKSKTIFTTIVIVCAAGIAALLINRDDAIEVQTQAVEVGAVQSNVANTRSGTIQACRRSKLATAVGGQISAINVKEGEQVKTGQLLLELWNRDILSTVEVAEAALQAHRLQQHSSCISAASDDREAKRLAELAQQELAAEEIVDRAVSRASASEANCLAEKSREKEFQAHLKVQQALLEKTYIRAPFDGTIANITGEVGEYTTPSPPGVPTPPAIDLLTADCFYLAAPIDEVDAAQVEVGQSTRVTIDAFRNTSFEGEVRRISPYVEDFAKQARTVEIEVSFDPQNQLLLAGYSADVEVILASKKDVLRIPTEAIMEGQKVWVLHQEKVIEKEISTGIGNWKYTEVVDGLNLGERIITSLGISNLAPGISAKNSLANEQ